MSNCYKAIRHHSSHESHRNQVNWHPYPSKSLGLKWVESQTVFAFRNPTLSLCALSLISSLQLLLLFLYLSLRSLPQKLSLNSKPNKDYVYHLMIYLVPIFVTQKFDRSAVSFCEESDDRVGERSQGLSNLDLSFFGCNKIRTHYTKKNTKGQNPKKKEIESGDQKIS